MVFNIIIFGKPGLIYVAAGEPSYKSALVSGLKINNVRLERRNAASIYRPSR